MTHRSRSRTLAIVILLTLSPAVPISPRWKRFRLPNCVEQPDGGLLGEWTTFEGDVDWNNVRELYQLVSTQCSRSVFDDLLRPSEPTDRQDRGEESLAFEDAEREFFELIAGEWHLTYYRGSKGYPERLRIDTEGNYFTQKRGAVPYFQLRDVYFDPDGQNVSFTKVEATGPKKGMPRQVEVLRIDPEGKWMKGYAQHDGHRLEYVRVDSVQHSQE